MNSAQEFLETVKIAEVTPEFINSIKENQRVILECPEYVPGIELGEPQEVSFERTVVVSDFFGPSLPEGQILVQHNCWFRPVQTAVKAHLSFARVAGYRHLIFGLPEENYPILFEHPDNPNVLIAATPLSSFIEGRFAPKADWQVVIGRLKSWLNGKDDIDDVDWEMSVRPSYGSKDKLPENVEKKAFKRNAEWFGNNMFFEHQIGGSAPSQFGVFEGYISSIEPNGRQALRPKTRGDCSGEGTMVPAMDWALNKNYAGRKMFGRIMDHLFNGPELYDNDPKSQTYGGLRFYEHVPIYYSEGRAPLACILASELTENYDYIEYIMRNLLSLLRTTGPKGFRKVSLRNPESFEGGKTWKYYNETDFIEYRPHFQGYMWAAFLQAYALTNHKEFLEKAKCGIRMTMDVFPDFTWMNGIAQEYARLILPLAFLVQIEDTQEHRQWLRTVTETLLANVHKSGAIPEMMGKPEQVKYPAPRSNEAFGTAEAALIQENGDPAADLVYTVNYAFIGLHEAAMATDDEFYKSATDKLADFLCRIQIRSDQQKYLDGAWMRGFDYELWEFFGSSSDKAWGAWCVESGWTNTWIAATLGLRAMNRPLLCHKNSNIYKKIMPKLLEEMAIVHAFSPEEKQCVRGTVPGAE